MKKTSKILSVVLVFLMVVSIIPLTASAATYSGTCGDNLTWTYDSSNGCLTISGTGNMYDYNYNNRPWESYEDKIKTVVLEDGVTATGNYAFFDFNKLVNVTISNSVKILGNRTFSSCNNLSSITIPDGVTTIGDYAFSYCEKLITALIPNSVTLIGKYAFNDCEKLKSINIPDGVKIIEESAFNCCKVLTEVTIPNSVAKIGESAFYGCDGLTEIIIPDSVTTIGAEAFEYCDGLTSVTLGNGVTTIGKWAFGDCINIKNITIPANVTTIEDGAFRNCESMLNLTVDGNNPNYSNDEYGVLFNKDKTVLIQYPIGSAETNYTIPDSVIDISDYAFHKCNGLNDIIIPDSVTTVGYRGIAECENLKTITLGTNIAVLDSVAFYHSNQFIIFNYNGTSTQWNELLENNSDKSGILPVSYVVHCSDKDIYPSCGDNVSWKFDYDTGVLTLFGTGDMENYTYSTITGFCNYPWRPFYYQIKEVIICDGVTSIGNAAFCNCENLTNITISDSVTKIGDYAFYICKNLSSVKIPDSVTTIGKNAFACCYNLSSVTIGDGVATIGAEVFHGCSSLTSIVIPINVTSMGNEGTTYITDVYYEGTSEQWYNNFVYDPDQPISLYRPFYKATIHYNHHIHRYDSVVTPPTCTKQGYTTYTCGCGETYIEYIDAIGHNYTEEITTPATHTTTGVMTYTCHCGDTYTEVIEKLAEHNYESVVTAPTCTEQGYTTYTCECGDTYTDDYVNTVGHTPTNAVEENYVAPTCTANGSKDVVVYCFVCREEISRETVIINATGHSYTTAVTLPTCTEQGYTTYTCECGDTYIDNYVDATGHADNDGNGYCDADNELLDPSVECDHNCHKTGISGFFWKIANFFNKLFRTKQYCECGVAHY